MPSLVGDRILQYLWERDIDPATSGCCNNSWRLRGLLNGYSIPDIEKNFEQLASDLHRDSKDWSGSPPQDLEAYRKLLRLGIINGELNNSSSERPDCQ